MWLCIKKGKRFWNKKEVLNKKEALNKRGLCEYLKKRKKQHVKFHNCKIIVFDMSGYIS